MTRGWSGWLVGWLAGSGPCLLPSGTQLPPPMHSFIPYSVDRRISGVRRKRCCVVLYVCCVACCLPSNYTWSFLIMFTFYVYKQKHYSLFSRMLYVILIPHSCLLFMIVFFINIIHVYFQSLRVCFSHCLPFVVTMYVCRSFYLLSVFTTHNSH